MEAAGLDDIIAEKIDTKRFSYLQNSSKIRERKDDYLSEENSSTGNFFRRDGCNEEENMA